MHTFVIQRSAKAVLTIFAVLIFVFVGARLTGDPISMMFPEGLSVEQHRMLLEQYGLDQPIIVQFQVYLQNVLQGDFGISIIEKRPVTEIFADAAAATFTLGIWAFIFSSIAGVAVGILASLKPHSRFARGLMFISCIGYSVPGFIIAIMLILVFSYHLKWLPSMGMSSAANYIMPVIAISVRPIASIARYVHNSFMEVLSQHYIRTARAKGLGERLVILKHAFRNTLIPLVTVIGMLVIDIVSGALFIEVVFSWSGMGKRLIESVMNKDFPVIQFGVVAISFVVVFVNLLVDILYGFIDPRIRKAGKI